MGFWKSTGNFLKHAVVDSAPVVAAKGIWDTGKHLAHGEGKKALHDIDHTFNEVSNKLPLPNPIQGAENVIKGVSNNDSMEVVEGMGDFINPMLSHIGTNVGRAVQAPKQQAGHTEHAKEHHPANKGAFDHPRKRMRYAGGIAGTQPDITHSNRTYGMQSKVSGHAGHGYMMQQANSHSKWDSPYVQHSDPGVVHRQPGEMPQQQFRGQQPHHEMQSVSCIMPNYAQGPAPMYSDY